MKTYFVMMAIQSESSARALEECFTWPSDSVCTSEDKRGREVRYVVKGCEAMEIKDPARVAHVARRLRARLKPRPKSRKT